MKALRFEKTGEPLQVLKLRDIEKPEPGEGEVRLKVIGSPINPADELFIRGNYRIKPEFPQTGGLEGAGIVDAVGNGMNLSKGKKAAFLTLNTWAEYVIVPEDALYPLPDDYPLDKAVQFSLNPFTAWGLLEDAQLKENDWLLLTAGNSAVSKIVLQLAVARNINVISTVRNPMQAAPLKSLGAREVINTFSEYLPPRVLAITGGKGVNAILDSVGGETGTDALNCAANNARIIIYGLLSQDKVEFHNSVILFKNLILKGFGVRNFLAGLTHSQKSKIVQQLTEITKKDQFKLDIAGTYRLKDFEAAFSSYHREGKTGKIVFKI